MVRVSIAGKTTDSEYLVDGNVAKISSSSLDNANDTLGAQLCDDALLQLQLLFYLRWRHSSPSHEEDLADDAHIQIAAARKVSLAGFQKLCVGIVLDPCSRLQDHEGRVFSRI